MIYLLTGLPCSGKSTLAKGMVSRLSMKSTVRGVEVLDGDRVRQGLSKDLGFSPKDRRSHLERVVYCARLLERHKVEVVIPMIAPYREDRRFARDKFKSMVEIYVKCSVDECRERDVKGMYLQADQDIIQNFTGVQDPYEEPEHPDIIVDTDKQTVAESLNQIYKELGI